MQVVRYDSTQCVLWDALVRKAKNGVFLFERAYMEYHADRFVDCSLLFYEGERLIALLPAHFVEAEGYVASHNGLTYGGFVVDPSVTTSQMLLLFETAIGWFKSTLGATSWYYKPIPYIYAEHPAQEDLYALFRGDAQLVGRKIASVVDQRNPMAFRASRKQGAKRAAKNGVVVLESDTLVPFWQLLSELLHDKYRAKPVHSLLEMKTLQSAFPNQIRLFTANKEGRVLAGCLIYETARVAHCQYIASSEEGRDLGALDAIFDNLIGDCYSDKYYFDLGTSTEGNGEILNTNLIFQKEGFGARGVVYDSYKIDLG